MRAAVRAGSSSRWSPLHPPPPLLLLLLFATFHSVTSHATEHSHQCIHDVLVNQHGPPVFSVRNALRSGAEFSQSTLCAFAFTVLRALRPHTLFLQFRSRCATFLLQNRHRSAHRFSLHRCAFTLICHTSRRRWTMDARAPSQAPPSCCRAVRASTLAHAAPDPRRAHAVHSSHRQCAPLYSCTVFARRNARALWRWPRSRCSLRIAASCVRCAVDGSGGPAVSYQCRNSDVLSTLKRDYIVSNLLSGAKKMLSDAILVRRPSTEPLTASDVGGGGQCGCVKRHHNTHTRSCTQTPHPHTRAHARTHVRVRAVSVCHRVCSSLVYSLY